MDVTSHCCPAAQFYRPHRGCAIWLIAPIFALVWWFSSAAFAGWVPLGSTGYYLWEDASGHYDGWWYTRTYSPYGGYSFARYARFDSTPSTYGGYGAWRDKLVDAIAQQQATRARLAEAAADHAAFLETVRATGLQLAPLEISGYGSYGGGGAYGHAGQQTVYGQVGAPLADAYKNFDVEARLAALQRLDEEHQAGHVKLSEETRKTLREALGTYERLKTIETRKDAAAAGLRGLKELLNDPPPAKASPVASAPGERDGGEHAGELGALTRPRSPASPAASPVASAPGALAKIIAANCVDCHGPRRAEKGLRLDVPAQFADRYDAILARVNSDRPEVVMPPPSSGKRLTAAEKAAFELGEKTAPEK